MTDSLSKSVQDNQAPKKSRGWILVGLIALAILFWGANWYFLEKCIHDQAKQGQFGDMFGSVNALFTALAFAGLIYTAILQRDQLAVQQREITESRNTQRQLVQDQIKAQKTLFEEQKTFQEEQRQKQVEHDLKLEQLRQDFEEIAERHRKERESQANKEFERNVLRAIRRELEVLPRLYDAGIGADLARVPAGQALLLLYVQTQDPCPVYMANAVHLGRVDADVSRRVIAVHALMKALVETYRINNQYLIDLRDIQAALRLTPTDSYLQQRRSTVEQRLIEQTDTLRLADRELQRTTTDLFSALNGLGIQ